MEFVSSLSSQRPRTDAEELFAVAIPQKNLRRLAAALQCMSKIGNEVSFEVSANTFLLRVLDDSKTAFLTLNLGSNFFEQYAFRGSRTRGGNPDVHGILKFKCLLRPLTSILRSLRTVGRMEMRFSDEIHISMLTLQLYCARGIVKTHTFQVEQTEILQVLFNRDVDGPNKFSIKPKTLFDILDQIHGAEQIVFSLKRTKVKVVSHHHNIDEAGISLASEVVIPMNELRNVSLNRCGESGVELICCLKELKAFLNYCLSPGVAAPEIHIFFRVNGSPILFTTPGAHFAELIMATVAEEQVNPAEEAEHHLGGTVSDEDDDRREVDRTVLVEGNDRHAGSDNGSDDKDGGDLDKTVVVPTEGGGNLDKTVIVQSDDSDDQGYLESAQVPASQEMEEEESESMALNEME